MRVPLHVKQFAEAAEQFCAWAEGVPLSQDEPADALMLLTNLYQLALQLPALFGEEEPSEVTDDGMEKHL